MTANELDLILENILRGRYKGYREQSKRHVMEDIQEILKKLETKEMRL